MRLGKWCYPVFGCVFVAASGCSYNAHVVSTSSAASEIRLDKHVDENVAYSLSSELDNLHKEVKPSSYVCSAHKYPLEAGAAIRESIRSVLDQAFLEVYRTTSPGESSPGTKYQLNFDLEEFQPRLTFSPGFWSATIDSNVELVLKVRVMDSNGDEIIRTMVSGHGSENGSGQCGDGSKYLADATQEAIERTLENFIYKTINSDYFASAE